MTMTEMPNPLDLLARDINSFADPGTRIDRAVDGDWHVLVWTQDGRSKTARFKFGEELYPAYVEIDEAVISYRSFLSGPQMADLRAAARNLLNIMPPAAPYVPLLARQLDDAHEAAEIQEAESLIADLTDRRELRTNVVFISAPAGVGKTTLLKEMVRRQATRYIQGEADALWLYVDAQGRRLAQLDEAIAAELDDIRARFPYHAASALVRAGAMVLVVDGFDELVGSVGSYDEAFSSLSSFISDLQGDGCLVAAARSSYYEQEFLSRANASVGFTTDTWVLSGVRLLDWNDLQRDQFISDVWNSYGVKRINLELLTGGVRSLLDQEEVVGVGHKPFFVSRTVDILLEREEWLSGATLLDGLVSAYIDREVNQKMRSGRGDLLLTAEQYRTLLTEIAEEMWRQETRELSRTSVRELTQILGELMNLPEDVLGEVVLRLPDAALLSKGSVYGSVAFEHDIYYSYFLADPLAVVWQSEDSTAMGRLLRRGRLPEEAAIFVGRRLADQPPQPLLDVLSRASGHSVSDVEQVRRNAGFLAANLLNERKVESLTISDLIIGDAAMNTSLVGCRIERCHFSGTDLTKAQFVGSTGVDLVFDRVLVQVGTTSLDLSGTSVEDFYGLIARTPTGDRMLYSPADMRSVLLGCGLAAAQESAGLRQVPEEIVNLLVELCWVFSKTNVVTEEDTEMRNIVSSAAWADLRQALVDSEVVTTEVRSARGRKVFLRRHFRAQDIMAGLDSEADVAEKIRNLWEMLEA